MQQRGAEPCAAGLCGPPSKIFTFCATPAEFFHYSRQKARSVATELVKNSHKINGRLFNFCVTRQLLFLKIDGRILKKLSMRTFERTTAIPGAFSSIDVKVSTN